MGKEFHLPVTSVAVNKMIMKTRNQLTLKQESVDFVRVSLARPFLPWQSSHHLDKPHCYAMLTGVVLSMDNDITIM